MSLILGITGGIGSGKSVVSSLLRLMDVPVYDCDSRAKKLMVSDEMIGLQLKSLVGENVYMADGNLNKPLLASYLFANEEHTIAVNSIVHPRVKEDFDQWVTENSLLHSVLAFESAILYEAHFEALADKVALVYAPKDIRMQRAVERDHSTPELVKKRMNVQMDEDVKRERADYVIFNDEEHAVLEQVETLIHDLKNQLPV